MDILGDGLSDLPNEVVGRIAEFLEIRDAVRLSTTCRRIHTNFPLVTLNPAVELLTATQFSGESRDLHRRGPEIPVVLGSRTHSIVVDGIWRDQGFGYQKGGLFIVAHDRNKDENIDNFMQGRLVRASPVAPHRAGRVTLSFRPRSNEVYHIWYIVGGGEHILEFTTPLTMHTIIFDTEKRPLSRAYRKLQKATSIPAPGVNCASDFWPGLLHAAALSLVDQLRRNNEVDPIMSQYLEAHGFDIDQYSLEALSDMCSRFGNVSLG